MFKSVHVGPSGECDNKIDWQLRKTIMDSIKAWVGIVQCRNFSWDEQARMYFVFVFALEATFYWKVNFQSDGLD